MKSSRLESNRRSSSVWRGRKARRALLRVTSLALAVAGFAAPPVRGQDIKVELDVHGMVGVVPGTAGNSALLLLPNALDRPAPAPEMPHQPMLEVRCRDLENPQLAAKCARWPKGISGGTNAVRLEAGYDIAIGPPVSSANLTMTGLTNCSSGFVEIGKVSSSISVPSAVLKPTNGDLVLGRVLLSSGSLSASCRRPGIRDPWRIRYQGGDTQLGNTIDSLKYELSIAAPTVTITLTPFDTASASTIELKLRPNASGVVRIGLTNEPAERDFCEHEPANGDSYGHFRLYYDLTDSANPGALALPYSKSRKGCASHLKNVYDVFRATGRYPTAGHKPIICMMALYPATAL